MNFTRNFFTMARTAALLLLAISVLVPGVAGRMVAGCGLLDDCCDSSYSLMSGEGNAAESSEDASGISADDDCPDNCLSCSCCAPTLAFESATVVLAFSSSQLERSPAPQSPVDSPREGAALSVFRPPRSVA